MVYSKPEKKVPERETLPLLDNSLASNTNKISSLQSYKCTCTFSGAIKMVGTGVFFVGCSLCSVNDEVTQVLTNWAVCSQHLLLRLASNEVVVPSDSEQSADTVSDLLKECQDCQAPSTVGDPNYWHSGGELVNNVSKSLILFSFRKAENRIILAVGPLLITYNHKDTG